MIKKSLVAATLLAACPLTSLHAGYADSVVAYESGTGFSDGYTDPSSALGAPSNLTPDPFGGPVDPFSPPWKTEQLVSVGAGGSLTLQFDSPIFDSALNPFGIDFMIYGNSGFMVTNDFDIDFNWIGEPATDGTLFSSDSTGTRVLVSQDNINYYALDMTLAPVVETLFPTDGSGDFSLPVDPSLSYADFAGLTLEGIRTAYAGSGGGAGFDLAWARDGGGDPISLSEVNFIRIEVLSGKVEIDAVSVVPEPGTVALISLGGLLLVGRRLRSRRF